MLVSLVSLLTDKPVRNDVAMTGEITCAASSYPGRHKTEGPRRTAGRDTEHRPAEAQREGLEEVPESIKNGMDFKFIEKMDEAIDICLANK
jgi:ATP-dependent Lon protease